MCCKCGFIHRDDRILIGDKPYRAYKPHYHWIPRSGELELLGIRYHATICVACCDGGGSIDWLEYSEYKKGVASKYFVKYSLNAVLPSRYDVLASDLYEVQCVYLRKSHEVDVR